MDNREPINYNDYMGWLNHPVTIWFMEQLRNEVFTKSQGIGRGDCINHSSIDNTALNYANESGYVKGLNKALSTKPVQTYSEDSEEIDKE